LTINIQSWFKKIVVINYRQGAEQWSCTSRHTRGVD